MQSTNKELFHSRLQMYAPFFTSCVRDRVACFFLQQFTRTGKKNPNGHKRYQMALKYFKLQWNIATYYFSKPPRMYPYLDFWSENIPSGNPGSICQRSVACPGVISNEPIFFHSKNSTTGGRNLPRLLIQRSVWMGMICSIVFGRPPQAFCYSSQYSVWYVMYT
jgi:hypothetical protein